MKRMKTLVSLLLVVVMALQPIVPVRAEVTYETTTDSNGDTWDSTVYYREDFEYEGDTPDYLVGASIPEGIYWAPSLAGSNVSAVADGDNTALNIYTVQTSGNNDGYQVNVRWSNQSAWSEDNCVSDWSEKTVVYEFKLKLRGESNGFSARLRSKNGGNKDTVLFSIANNELQVLNATPAVAVKRTLEAGASAPWYTFKVICDFKNKTRDIYLNDELIADDVSMHNATNFYPAAVCDFIRFGSGSSYGLNADILIDDFAVYESAYPVNLSFAETEKPINILLKENFEYDGDTADYFGNPIVAASPSVKPG